MDTVGVPDSQHPEVSLRRIEDSDSLLAPPSAVTAAPVIAKLGLLPTNQIEDPRDFERLLLKMSQDVLGLSDAQLFGVPGQAQFGLDSIGYTADETPVGVQGKAYKKFGVANLNAAVDKYVTSKAPIKVSHLYIGVSCLAERTEVLGRLRELNETHAPLKIELWDQRRISDLLRRRPDIVSIFFSDETTAAFCLRVQRDPVIPPAPPERADVADAIMRGPELSTGAAGLVARADAVVDSDPAAAASDLEQAAERLKKAGFAAHASALSTHRAEALAKAGEVAASAELLSAVMWDGMRRGDLGEARIIEGRLRGLELTSEPDGEASHRVDVASAALGLLRDDEGDLTEASDILDGAYTASPELAELAVLAAETAVADDNLAWIRARAQTLLLVAEGLVPEHVDIAVRLRLCVADATGEWTPIVSDARRHKLDRSQGALALARYGRFLTLKGSWSEAATSWNDAIEKACLEGRNADAAAWQYALRRLELRTAPKLGHLDDRHRLAMELDALAGPPAFLEQRRDIRERGLEALRRSNSWEAVYTLRSYVRTSIVTGRWGDEQDARILLAEAYTNVGDHTRAALNLISANEHNQLKKLAASQGDGFLDVTSQLDRKPYWERACVYTLLAEQADLIPDSLVDKAWQAAMGTLDEAAAGTLVDTTLFDPSVCRAAHDLLAPLADRVPQAEASRLLEHLRPLARREALNYRYTDDAHVEACARIAASFPAFRQSALDQLLLLIEGDVGVRARAERHLNQVLAEYVNDVRPRLEALAHEGNERAIQALVRLQDEPTPEQQAWSDDALAKLTEPIDHEPGVYSLGTGAVSQSLLVLHRSPEERGRVVLAQLDRASSEDEIAPNRGDYLTAAANVAPNLPADMATLAFDRARALALNDKPSMADIASGGFGSSAGDARPEAVLLAAVLANTDERRDIARNLALSLLALRPEAGWHVVHALRRLDPENLGSESYLLAAHDNWAVRSLAAIAWAANREAPAELGTILARDRDHRVRRTLAEALSRSSGEGWNVDVRSLLESDVRYSVRKALAKRTEKAHEV